MDDYTEYVEDAEDAGENQSYAYPVQGRGCRTDRPDGGPGAGAGVGCADRSALCEL